MNAQVVRAKDDAEAADRKVRVAKAMADTLAAALAEIDRKRQDISGFSVHLRRIPEDLQEARLEKQLAVAYERIADAVVESQDAHSRLRMLVQEMPSRGGE
jgi:hypothetical protein